MHGKDRLWFGKRILRGGFESLRGACANQLSSVLIHVESRSYGGSLWGSTEAFVHLYSTFSFCKLAFHLRGDRVQRVYYVCCLNASE